MTWAQRKRLILRGSAAGFIPALMWGAYATYAAVMLQKALDGEDGRIARLKKLHNVQVRTAFNDGHRWGVNCPTASRAEAWDKCRHFSYVWEEVRT